MYLEVVLLYQQCDVQQQTLLIKRPEARRHTPIVHLGQVHLHICPGHNTPGGMKESEVQEMLNFTSLQSEMKTASAEEFRHKAGVTLGGCVGEKAE